MTTAARVIIDAEYRDDETFVDAVRIIEGVLGYIADNVVVHSDQLPPAGAVPTHEVPAAVFTSVTDGESDVTVSGDVNELLYFLSPHQLAVFKLSLNGDPQLESSANYGIVPWVQRNFPGVQLDPEHSCFWAYAKDHAVAQRLADAINNREWAVPA